MRANWKWGAGLATLFGAWVFWPRGSNASGGSASDPSPLEEFVVVGPQQRSMQSANVTPLSSHLKADVGSAAIQGFQAPDAYASRRIWYLQPQALRSLQEAQRSLRQRGLSVVLVDAYRTRQEQVSRQQERPDLAVSPEASNHTKGLAIDARLYDPRVAIVWQEANPKTWGSQATLAKALSQNGWQQHPREPWHFDYIG